MNSKRSLKNEHENLEEQPEYLNKSQEDYMELTEKTFNFACYAKRWFENGDSKEKSLILKSLGYTLTLQGKKIQFSIQKPFYLVRKTYEKLSEEMSLVETGKSIDIPINYGSVPNMNSIMSDLWNACPPLAGNDN